MKKKTFSLITAMLMLATVISAQQLNFGVKGGVNMSNYQTDDLNDKGLKIGFNVGVSADYDFAPNSAIQTGLFFTTKGTKYSISAGNVSAEFTMNPMYLQLPVHYAYKLDVTPGTRIVFHAGPYLAYGVGGKTKMKGSYEGWSNKTEEKIFEKGKFKPFDAGLGLGVGAEFGQIILDLGWDMGLVNVADNKNIDAKNQNAYLSVGYKF